MNKTIKKELILLEDLGTRYPTEKSKAKKRYGLYRCSCGEEFEAQTAHIKSGNTKSCGCLKINTAKGLNLTHNLTNHRLFVIRTNIIQRCTNPNNPKYKNYGKRGISICDEWKNDFLSFYNWALSNGYSDNLSIDRINNDGNYEPNNCRWATNATQSRNKRKIMVTNTSGYKGVSPYRKIWVVQISINSKKIKIGYFNNAYDGALAYDNYIIDNNLEHTKNFS